VPDGLIDDNRLKQRIDGLSRPRKHLIRYEVLLPRGK
jgi:hypothetical protein